MKNNTLVIIVALASLLVTGKSEAQDNSSKVKEFGVGLSSLNSFSLQYRWGNEHRLFRFTGDLGVSSASNKASDDINYPLSGSSSSNTIQNNNPIDFSLGVSFSILKMKPVAEKFGFFYGGIFALSYSMEFPKTDQTEVDVSSDQTFKSTTKEQMTTLRASAGMVLGAYYKFSPSFLVYAEIDPQVYFAYQNDTQDITTTTSYPGFPDDSTTKTEKIKNPGTSFGLMGLSNNFASLTFVYRFSK